ncbi:50S ribosomal protein L25 [Patescibacteria group bacterium]|nr:50S ribosomal protein L25 [Patescibacteria group bacterium]MBU1663177.1 50S ribosomal protein L25 [Patescibacteria group bacterium]MBU1934302.1 50S ribosomal protein L25 [Patescibacteria group bacterium]MBU2008141.1 50S ribosomal protein L25 [Patescibacteria group bacterium]MBU2233237.1 50S ribosomal protein L25 [Patescibacteria group bacterium]
MTTKVQLNVQSRSESNGKAKNIRATGFIPAVIYGFGKDNKNIKVKKHDFEKVFAIAGEFNLVDLSIDQAQPVKVIIKDVQRDGLTDNVIHIDFYQVDMTKKIIAEIPLNFIGEAKAIKELGGTMVKNMDTVEVECLPGDLVSHIDVDISVLANFDQFIRLHDLVLSNGIVLAQETNEVVVGVVETKAEEQAPKSAEAVPSQGQEAAQTQEKTSVGIKTA